MSAAATAFGAPRFSFLRQAVALAPSRRVTAPDELHSPLLEVEKRSLHPGLSERLRKSSTAPPGRPEQLHVAPMRRIAWVEGLRRGDALAYSLTTGSNPPQNIRLLSNGISISVSESAAIFSLAASRVALSGYSIQLKTTVSSSLA
jgi:hypothetical protein